MNDPAHPPETRGLGRGSSLWALEAAADIALARHAGPAGIAERSRTRLAELVAHAVRHSPMHAQRFAGRAPDLVDPPQTLAQHGPPCSDCRHAEGVPQ